MNTTLAKVFPGNVVGLEFIRAVRGPLPHQPLLVTGGVAPTEATLRKWFGTGVNAVGIGSQFFAGAADPASLAPALRRCYRTCPWPSSFSVFVFPYCS